METTQQQPVMAVIGLVTQLLDIQGADRIKLATVNCGHEGEWNGVVSLNIVLGDHVTVLLQDALLPPDPRWDFMAKHKYRVRMARFKGVPSECVIIPGAPDFQVGTDLTEALGITKYSKPIPAQQAGEMKGNFPDNVPRTDEPNFQTKDLKWLMHGSPWQATEKADGTSCTVWVDHDGMHVCSRNWELKEYTDSGAGNVYWRAARKYSLEALPSDLALQFEVVGPGIQGNPMGLDDLEIRVFTLHNMQTNKRSSSFALGEVCDKLGLPQARVVASGVGPLGKEELRQLAQITYPNGKPGEGVVVRELDSSWSFKAINLLYKD